MLDANKRMAHIYKEYDPAQRIDVLKKETVIGSWFRKEQSAMTDKQVVVSDSVSVRIPIKNIAPIIKKGDVLVLGDCEIENKTIGAIRKEYPESFEVQSLTYNTNSVTGYSNHVRVSGS